MSRVESKKQTGVGLPEMLLVLSIVAIMLVMSTRYYLNHKRTAEIGAFQKNVSVLMSALNNYYFMHCWESTNVFLVNHNYIPDLQAAGLIAKNPNNPWGSFKAEIVNTSVSTDKGAPKFYVLRVTAYITKTNPHQSMVQNIELAAHLRGTLNADRVTQKKELEVIWTRLPLNTRDDLSSHEWIMNQRSGQAIMPGRVITAVNTGTGSKLWILNSGLQSFTNESDPKYAESCPN